MVYGCCVRGSDEVFEWIETNISGLKWNQVDWNEIRWNWIKLKLDTTEIVDKNETVDDGSNSRKNITKKAGVEWWSITEL